MQERWCKDCVEWVDRVPWNRYWDAEDADWEVPEAALVGGSGEVSGDVGSGESRVVFVDTREREPRESFTYGSRMRISMGILGDVVGAVVGTGDWEDSHTLKIAARGSRR